MPLLDIFLLALIPTLAMGLSSLFALWKTPGPALTSAFQHFTAGVILAATAVELLPDLQVEQHLLPVGIGFTLGVLLVLVLRELFDDGELDEPAGGGAALQSTLPLTFIVAVGVDLFTDGMLLGLAFAAMGSQGTVFLLALVLEVIFLALGSVVTLTARGVSVARAILTLLGLGAVIPVAALVGAGIVTAAPGSWKIGFLAFGVAALLYLVVEELLVEAHRTDQDTALVTAMFFLGFLMILLVDGAGL